MFDVKKNYLSVSNGCIVENGIFTWPHSNGRLGISLELILYAIGAFLWNAIFTVAFKLNLAY